MEIVVVGAGFGGMHFLRSFQKRVKRADIHYTLISFRDHFLFTPRLIEHFSTRVSRRHVVKQIAELHLPATTFLHETVQAVDLRTRKVITATREVSYDYLVLAPGSSTNFFNAPGAAEHSYPFKSYRSMDELREHLAKLAALEREITVAVIGGGYTGSELAFGLFDLLGKQAAITIIQAASTILPDMHALLIDFVSRRLAAKGITVLTNAQVTKVQHHALTLKSGKTIPADVIIWTAGITPNTIPLLPQAALQNGKYAVNEFLQLPDHPEVFALGDCATNATTVHHPPSAQMSRMQGMYAAAALHALLSSKPLRPFRFQEKAFIFLLDDNCAAMILGNRLLTGTLPWLLRKIIYWQRFSEI